MSFTSHTILLLLSCLCVCFAESCSNNTEAVFPCNNGFEVKNLLDQRYGSTAASMHKFDFFQPDMDMTETQPLIILLHPGAFILGDKSDYFISTVAKDFARCGFTTASINYRLLTDLSNTESLWDAVEGRESPIKRQLYDAVRDVRTAIRFFKANAQTYHIDTNRIFLAGYSAGAILALNVAFLDDSESGRFFTQNVVSGEDECLDCLPFFKETFPRKFDASVAGIVAINGALFDIACVSDADAAKTPALFVYSDNDEVIPAGEGKPYQKMFNQKNVEINLPSVAFDLGITRSTKKEEVEKTTVHGLDLSVVLPKWLPKIAASSITPKVYGSKAILQQLHRKHQQKIVLKGGHNFVSDPESGELSANYQALCSGIKSFFIQIDKEPQTKKNKKRNSSRRNREE